MRTRKEHNADFSKLTSPITNTTMGLLTTILESTLPVIAAVIASAIFICWYRHRNRPIHTPPPLPNGIAFGTKEPKLHVPYKPRSSSSRASLRFHHLYHEQGRHPPINTSPNAPFQWVDHPRLITEAVENGWSLFAFTFNTTTPISTRPLFGDFCPTCDACVQRYGNDSNWEVSTGSSERMQAVRLNPTMTPAKKQVVGIPSPIHGENENKVVNGLFCARMCLPLPGPELAGSPFPQEAYFEITIMYLNLRRLEWTMPRESKRGKDDGSGESDRTKLIGGDSAGDGGIDGKNSRKEARVENEGQEKKNKTPLVMSLGLTAMFAAPPRPSLPGTYLGSIGFDSNGALYLDGMKLAYESEKTSWAVLDRVIGCGYEPSKREVFFTVDGQLVHVINCNAETYTSPLYPVLASNFDVMVLVNLGQGKFKYSPANANRTSNPCFLITGSSGNDAFDPTVTDYDDNSDLFSVGRVDSGWLELSQISKSKSKKERGNAGHPPELDVDSELFEISLRD